MVYYQTLLGATAGDPQNEKTAFEILSGCETDDLNDWIGARPASASHTQISRRSKLRIQIVDPNIGSVDLNDAQEK